MTYYHPIKSWFSTFDDLVTQLNIEVERGYVNKKELDDLTLYDYNNSCVFDQAWTDASMSARGLVLSHSLKKIVALPFPKFFNLGENQNTITINEFNNSKVYEKYDGSCIIMFYVNGQWRCCTRGSFTSSQSVDAAQWLQHKINADYSDFDQNVTYLFEWVSTTNRIVLTYETEKLILIGAFNNTTFEDYDLDVWKTYPQDLMVAKQYSFSCLDEVMAFCNNETNEEGFVIRTPEKRVKVKTEWYIKAHKMCTNFSAKSVFECVFTPLKLGAVNAITEYKSLLPEEFYEEFDSIMTELETQWQALCNLEKSLMMRYCNLTDKEIGLSNFISSTEKSLIFASRKRRIKLPSLMISILAKKISNNMEKETHNDIL
jgi:RNA ligase